MTAIKLENVSKKYRIGGRGSLRDAVGNLIRRFSKDGLRKTDESREIWALKDVSFEVKKGEVLGIIGPNGAGKSTILKILAGVTDPTRGRIQTKGKLSALIEIGAGFHPDLTGRENIYLNGSILGIKRREIREKFDQIVQFAELEKFIDTPVKRYSSGMYVRLGFSVAAHIRPDILLVDEVLAVGDLAFALKCHRKMSEFRRSGKTVVIVAHNMHAIRNLCKTVLWLNRGKIKEIGEAHHVCDLYEADVIMSKKTGYDTMGSQLHYDPEVKISKVEFLDNDNRVCTHYKVGDVLGLRIHFACRRRINNPIFIVSIFNLEGLVISSNYSSFDGYKFSSILGDGYIDFCLNKLAFKPSKYICSVTFAEEEVSNTLAYHEKCYTFTVAGSSANLLTYSHGLINPFPKWSLEMKKPTFTVGNH